MTTFGSENKLKKIVSKIDKIQNMKGNFTEKSASMEDIDEGYFDIKELSQDKSALNKDFKRNNFPLIKKNTDFDVGELIPRIQTFVKCPICNDDFIVDEIRTFECDCKICIECLTKYLRVRYDSGKYDLDIPCFNDCKSKRAGCFPPTSINLVRECLGEEILEKMGLYLAQRIANKNCANLQCNLAFDFCQNVNDVDFVICDICNAQTCVKCWKLRHKGKPCTKVDESMRNYLLQNNEVYRICPNPNCLNPQPKRNDDECDHVECTSCKLNWCFSCSAIRSPILAHGNFYHRTNCKFYAPYLDQNGNDNLVGVKQEKNCTECTRLGRLCDRPNLTTTEFYESHNIDRVFIDQLN